MNKFKTTLTARPRPRLLTAGGRFLLQAAVLLLGSMSTAGTSDAAAEETDGRLRDTFSASCFECHAGEFAITEPLLDQMLDKPDGLMSDPVGLKRIRQVIAEGSMPPDDASQPLSGEDRQAVLTELDRLQKVLRQRFADDPGLVVMPLLNRTEFENAVRDLTGIHFDASAYIGSQGGAGEGFANVGEAHNFSPGQFNKMLQAAKDMLGHLRASPVNGLTWHAQRQRDVPTPKDRRRELIDAIMHWYVFQEALQCDEHFRQLKQSHDVSVANTLYLEAAWRHRFREELGHPDQTIGQLAASYDPPLISETLARWFDVLTGDQFIAPKGQAGREAWQQLPPPSEFPEKERRDVFDEFGHWWGAPNNIEFEEDWPRPYENFERMPDKKATDDGTWPLDIDVAGVETAYLVTSDLFDRNPHDVVRWSHGIFVFQDGSEQPWDQHVDALENLSGKTYPFARQRFSKEEPALKNNRAGKENSAGETGSEESGDAVVTVRAPEVLQLPIPKGAKRLKVTATIDPEKGSRKETLVQVAVFRDKPQPYHARHLEGRRGLSLSGNTGYGDAFRAGRALEFSVIERNRNSLRFEDAGIRTESNVLADLTHRYHEAFFDGPYPVAPSDPDPSVRPYYFTADMLRKYASPEAREELNALKEDLVAAAQIPVRKAQWVLEKNGAASEREGVLPEDPDVSGWDDVSRNRWPETYAAAVRFRRQQRQQAARLLESFTYSAWRGHLTPADLDRLVQLYADARSQGASFDEAIKVPLRFVLVSPRFLFRPMTGEAEDRIAELSDLELASRLSFGFWASIPDKELLYLAEQGRLRDPKVLRGQVRRMLQDDRVRGMANQFAGVWFRFSEFEKWDRPDNEKFPEFTEELRHDMAREAELFFADLFASDRPITDVLFADATFLNERLAKHYGIDGVEGEEFRRVTVPPEQRGGLLSMGSVLTSTSVPLRTSPVIRGAWVLEEILGQHLPAPPPVDPISEDEVDEQGRTIAEQLADHRASAACSGCHDRIDPLGLALENFDPIGRWRDADATGQTIEVSAETVDGKVLRGFADLRDYLQTRADTFTRLFCRKLAGYMLGRPLHPGDEALVDRMVEAVQANDGRVAAAVEELITSRQFLFRSEAQLTSTVSN